jgi:hypothetical protein
MENELPRLHPSISVSPVPRDPAPRRVRNGISTRCRVGGRSAAPQRGAWVMGMGIDSYGLCRTAPKPLSGAYTQHALKKVHTPPPYKSQIHRSECRDVDPLRLVRQRCPAARIENQDKQVGGRAPRSGSMGLHHPGTQCSSLLEHVGWFSPFCALLAGG